MSTNTLDRKFNEMLKIVALELKGSGFGGKGLAFRIVENGNCGIIEFQRSTRSNLDRLLFTVNLGIVCGKLINTQDAPLKKVHVVDAHIRQRIGMFLPERPDKWWEIISSTESGSLASELCELISSVAVPYILGLLSTAAIISLWKSGQCPGLTDGQRVRFLARLEESV